MWLEEPVGCSGTARHRSDDPFCEEPEDVVVPIQIATASCLRPPCCDREAYLLAERGGAMVEKCALDGGEEGGLALTSAHRRCLQPKIW